MLESKYNLKVLKFNNSIEKPYKQFISFLTLSNNQSNNNKNQVRGSVGFFSSAETKETGLGLFADLSQVVSADALRDLILSQNSKEPEFNVKSMSKSTQKKVFKGFIKVSKDSDQLNAQ